MFRCGHCGGCMFPDDYDDGELSCVNCGRSVRSEVGLQRDAEARARIERVKLELATTDKNGAPLFPNRGNGGRFPRAVDPRTGNTD